MKNDLSNAFNPATNPPQPRNKLQGYSANIRIEFHIEGKTVLPSQTNSDELIFSHAPNLTPSIGHLGELIVYIDSVPHRSTLKIMSHELSATQIPVERQK